MKRSYIGDVLRCFVSSASVFAALALNAQTATQDYPLSFNQDTPTTAQSALQQVTLQTNRGNSALPIQKERAYNDLSNNLIASLMGSNLNIMWQGAEGLSCYLYIDWNNNGQFESDELCNQTASGAEAQALPAYALPTDKPAGHYRARLIYGQKALPEGSADGYAVDFLLNLYGQTATLDTDTRNGNIYSSNPEGLLYTIAPFSTSSINLMPTPFAEGYEAKQMIIRHGYNLRGEQYVHGNLQWKEYSVPIASYDLPADSIDGDVLAKVYFEPNGSEEYECIFDDEFETGSGTEPDNTKWCRAPRLASHIAWGRYISDSPEVVYLKDGKLCTRAIPTPEGTDTVPMITGAVHTSGKFSFLYGKIECRAKTNPFVGNFPAIWMIPDDQSADWPAYGEIDIFETIDTRDRAWHTVHCAAGSRGMNEDCKQDRYHTYGLEWDDQNFYWYVDGKQVFSHSKSKNPDDLAKGQWPYDHNYYIILNQSVGMGTWAKNPDITHTYETDFDFVRVYQQKHFAENRIKQLIEQAEEQLTHHGIGCPPDDGEAREKLVAAINEARGKTSFDDFLTMRNALEAYQRADLVMPESGKAFVIRNLQKNGTNYVLTASTSGTLTARKATNATYTTNDIFVCQRLESGKYVFVSALNGNYLIWRGGKGGQNSNKGFMSTYNPTYCDFQLSSMGAYDLYGYFTILGKRAGGTDPGAFVLKSDGSFDSWNKSDIGYEDGYSNVFELQEVPYYNKVELQRANTVTCQTIYLPFATQLPEGVKAYGVTVDTQTNNLNINEVGVANRIVPKNTGVLLISENGLEEATLIPATAAGTSVSTQNNNFIGSINASATISTSTTYTYYAFNANGEQGAGFYAYTDNKYPIPHPVLRIKAAEPQPYYLFDYEQLSGIPTVTIDAQPSVIFDLQGRKVQNPHSGVYIVNGKKMIIK